MDSAEGMKVEENGLLMEVILAICLMMHNFVLMVL